MSSRPNNCKMGKFPFQFVFFVTVTVLAIIEFGSGQTVIPSNQTLMIGNDDPCAAELGVPSPSDNLSCEFVAPGGTFCYSRSELCNGDETCFTGSDEGANIAALDCEITSYHKEGCIIDNGGGGLGVGREGEPWAAIVLDLGR